jgi:hypothetical protein
VVQGCARDLLAAALLRFEIRALPVVFHCHDEVVIEVPEGSISESEVLAILLERPAWAMGLPLGGKVHTGPLYLEESDNPAQPKDVATAPAESIEPIETVDSAIDAFVAGADPLPATKAIEREAEEDFLASLDETVAPLTDLVSLPLDSANRVSCPFHDDPNPSCSIYPDHYHCHACGAHGSRLDWLLEVEGLTRAEAINALQDWHKGGTPAPEGPDAEEKLAFALSIWNAAESLQGSIGEKRYLAETRGIDVSKLPATIHEALRFHPRCPFGAGERHPCIIALMRDPVTDAPVGIHRIGLTQNSTGEVTKLDRRTLGRTGVVKLWPLNGTGQLVVDEGIETALAAATRMTYQGAPMTPAWSVVSKHGLAALPLISGVSRLIQLIDHDENGEGQQAAAHGRQNWSGYAPIVPLMPKQLGWDWNDAVLGRKA